MKKLILVVICLLYNQNIEGILLTKVAFLQIPELLQLHQMKEDKPINVVDDNELQKNEDEEEHSIDIDEIISPHELSELRDAVSVLNDYDVYEGIYDPFSNVTRKKRSVIGNDLSKYLSGMVDNFDKMLASKNTVVQKGHYNEAVEMLDNYIAAVKSTRTASEHNALQIFKQEQYNLLLINCGGWVWYPIKRIKKIVTCKNGNLRFERRYKKEIRVCDDFVCKKVKM